MAETNKRCGFVIRVSTDKQARNPEGSLTNQLQRLQAHVEYKNTACDEHWVEAGRYILKGVSGKDSIRSPEFAQLFADMESGKVNTVICTALDRISRSVKDFLNFFEVLTKYNVEFVCLKQNYDTTSSQGKLFITIMMALAEFERTQTSERNRDATIARAERGLWNGGHLLGFDLDEKRKGYLTINEQEKATIQFAFKKYLECGSLVETGKALNANGFRTKGYTSRRGKIRSPQKFGRTSTKTLLTNLAYIGKKEINKNLKTQDQAKLAENYRYRHVPAVWDPLVDEDTFTKVQHLLSVNAATKHNGTTEFKHTYILNSGLLVCAKCDKPMEGTCGTGHQGNKYFYYHCKHCKFKMPASEVEQVIIDHIKMLGTQEDMVEAMVREANSQLQKELPQLKTQRDALQRKIETTKSQADGIMVKWTNMATDDNSIFLREKLDELAKQRKEAETGFTAIDIQIKDIQRDAIRKEDVLMAVDKFNSLFDTLHPYQKKEIFKLLLKKAVLGPEGIKIALFGKYPQIGLFDTTAPDGAIRCQTSIWLPLEDSNLGPGGYA
ncbi:MAG: recombinase family protein [Candidatus Omnitrophica bacterium]|nr:recombinase family protein [Candidatus Omnitrophota bacterium]